MHMQIIADGGVCINEPVSLDCVRKLVETRSDPREGLEGYGNVHLRPK